MVKMQGYRFFSTVSLLVSSLCASGADHAGVRLPGMTQSVGSNSSAREQWVQLAKLSAGGGSVAISGDTIAAGNPCDCRPFYGSAALFLKPKSGWNSLAPAVQLANADDGAGYGSTVAVSSGVAIVADPDITWSSGYGFVFLEGRRGWKLNSYSAASLGASDSKCYEDFCIPGLGQSLAISDNTVVAGGPYDGEVGGKDYETGPGAAFVFMKPATGWANMTETAKLTASHPRKHDALGWFVAMSGNTVVANGRGAEYVYVKPARGWENRTQTARLTASDGSSLGDVAMSGDTVVATNNTAVYLFVKPKSRWTNMSETAKLSASDGTALGGVAMSGDTVVATGGAWVYVFVKPAGGWVNMTETAKVTDSDGVGLGPIAISGNTIAAADGNYTVYVFGESQ